MVGGNGYPGLGGSKGNGLSAVAGGDPAATASLAALTAASNHNFSPTSAAAATTKQTAADLMKQPSSILHSTAHHNQVGNSCDTLMYRAERKGLSRWREPRES